MEAPAIQIAPRSVQQQAIERLRAVIVAGMFKPGDRLVESTLCDLLGVSRPSVREALRSLEAERLVTLIPNKGPHIPILTWEYASAIYKVRALLEGEASALAATLATRDDIKAMRIALTAFGRAVRRDDAAQRISATAEFYRHILRVCGNQVIEETLQGLLARINFLRGQSMSMPGRAEISHLEMLAILDAIERNDSEAARLAAVQHVAEAHRSAEQYYKAITAEPPS
ncbi:GntR family transcriptional regulator [Bradyrhizobium sp. RDM4]|uniref:GntR family transcriptional regulator n=1 Tax=Bradyrhizobium sp. RDM4 TaxID=3378765 RepID=UPI0038FCCEAB